MSNAQLTPLPDNLVGRMAEQADLMIAANLRLLSRRDLVRSIRARRWVHDPIFWNSGVLSWGLRLYVGRVGGVNSQFPNNDRLLRSSHRYRNVDDALFLYANFDSLSRQTLDTAYTYISRQPRDAHGSIRYRPGSANAFVDTTGMVAPFLVRYGQFTGNRQAVELGVKQLVAFCDHGFDSRSRLPYHGYSMEGSAKRGIIGWGRGVGWLMLGLSECLAWLDREGDGYQFLLERYSDLAETVLQYLREDGSFSWQLPALDGNSDTSVTGMIGYSIARFDSLTGADVGSDALTEMLAYLVSRVGEDGLIGGSSAECRGFAMYPQTFEPNAWGQGFGLMFSLSV